MTEIAPETRLRVFVSAPDDVADERALVGQICGEISREFGGRLHFALSGAAEDRPSQADLVVCLLWKELGTTLPSAYDRPDGTPRTGLEFEFEDALESALRRETPDILVYKKRVLIDAELADAATAELRALNAFWQKWFCNERGHFTASFDGFETADEFGDKLRRHLRQWVLRRRQDVTWPVALKGSPYRSLEPFEAAHAAVFFGRRQAARKVVAKLAAAAARGCAFLVVLGGSGSGKSSLVRAGVIPWLIDHGVVPDVAAWRSAVVRPAALGDDLLLGLARALFDRDALPELAASDYPSPERLAGLAQRSVEAAAILVSGALRALHPTKETRLLLLVDQLEELLARPAEIREGLVALLDALARSGRVWVIATLRSDRYPEFQAAAGLLRLKDDGDSFDLLPPDQAEIRDIIEGPARAAGLTLEESGERSLAVLLEDASRERGALPLLQFTLHRLFLDRDVASGTLLLGVYDRLGGLAGAIAGEAEKTVAALEPLLQAALPRLLLALVELADGKDAASARAVRYAGLADPAAQALADRLVEGRFLALDGHGPDATLRLAHEALLTRWPLLTALVQEHRGFLATRTRLGTDAARWTARDLHADFLLPAGRRLAEASDALASHRADLDPAVIAYVDASLEAERQRVADRQEAERRLLQARAEAAEARARTAGRLVRRTRIAAGVVTLLLIGMVGTAVLWLGQRQLAQARAVEAEQNYATALKAATAGVALVGQARAAGQLPNDVAGELLDATRLTVDRLGGDSPSTEILATKAEMLNQLAQAAYLAGKFTDALTSLRQELALATELAAREPDNDKWQWSLNEAHESLGQYSEQAGDLSAAAEHYQAMRAIDQRMVAKLPDNVPWRNSSFVALAHLAETARARGDLPQAVTGFRETLAHFTASPGTAPTVFDQYITGVIRLGLARALLAQGDVDGTVEQRRTALASFDALGEREPGNHNWRFLSAMADSELGDGLRIKGDLDGATAAFQDALAVQRKLTVADQSNYLFRNNFAAAGRGRADVLLASGQTETALKLYRTELETIAGLAEHDPTNSFWQRNLGQLHGRVGDALMDLHDKAAEQEYRASLAVTERLGALDPSNTDWQRELALADARLGDWLHGKGDDADAATSYRARLAILDRLVKLDPSNVTWQRDLAAAHGKLGLALAALGDHAASHAEFAACAALPRPAIDTDTVYNRPEDMHDSCAQQL